MDFFSSCSGSCCVCVNAGHCLAGHGNDEFREAKIPDVLNRLKNGNYPDYRQYMIGYLVQKGMDYNEIINQIQ